MLGERAGKLERKREPHDPYLWLRRAPSFKPVEKRGIGSPVKARHSTSKGCPRSPRRHATEQNKAKLSPWTLGGIASAQADRPRTARCKANQGRQGQGPERGTVQRKRQLPSSRRRRHPAPLSARTRLVLETNKQRGAHLEVLPPRALPRPACCHIRRAGAQARLAGVRH